MGFLTEQESASLRLARMSLHIVGNEDEFEPQPELPIEHDDFLLDVIKDIAADSVYRFAEESTTRTTLEELSVRKVDFEKGAQTLARDFCRFHAQAKDGAFFVFELGVEQSNVKIYALVKYDYSQALELVHKEGATGLRKIVEAFVGSKSAIQKSALVRIRDGKAEDQISTRDRMGRPSPMITDFFRKFLEVTRDRDDDELTKDVKDLVRTALEDNKEYLPKGNFASCVSQANAVLRAAKEINEDVIRQAVWVGAGQPDNEDTKGHFDKSTERLIRKKKLEGISFAPAPSVLPRTVKRTVTTDEGVKIEYNTALEGQSIIIEDLPAGGTRFVITTQGYTDDVNSDNSRRTS